MTDNNYSTREFHDKILGYSIDTTLIEPRQPIGSALLMHGAGKSDKSRLAPLAYALGDIGYRALLFSLPGHGESSGELLKSSLKERRDVTRELAVRHKFLPATIGVGISMGAHTAASFLEEDINMFKTLALIVPAAYSSRAENIVFGEGFTDIIRSPNSFADSELWKVLPNYTGSFTTIEAGKDTVIPSDVLRLYHEHTPNVSQKERVVVAESPHLISKWINEKPSRAVTLAQALHKFDFSDLDTEEN